MGLNNDESQPRWNQYYKVVSGRLAREFFRKTVRRFDASGFAIDLGCGTGTEALFLLKKGWQILAIDQEETAVQHVHKFSICLQNRSKLANELLF